jgi:hypothetical protein
MVPCEEASPRGAFWRPSILSENAHRDIDFSAGARDNVFLPLRAVRKGCRRDEADEKGSNTVARAHAASQVG